MLTEIIALLILLLLAAAFTKGGFAFTILYLFLGGYIVSLAWTRQSAKNVLCERNFEKRAFWGEEIPVRLKIQNRGWLPIPWLYAYESLPIELTAGNAVKRIISLRPHGTAEIIYKLSAHKRGYYPLGPIVVKFGDTLGLANLQELDKQPDYITIFPHIIPLTNMNLPSRSPIGTLRHHQPIFEDPSRVRGKRDYTSGDSLRRVDWKASAAIGRLQVKQFEPSIALQTVIFLNLNNNEYPRHRIDAIELSIVLAASLANWIVEQKQSTGLITNGIDPHTEGQTILPISPRKGRGQLLHILDTLARVQSTEALPLTKMLSQETPRLAWGTTVIVITGHVDEALFDELFQIRRRGQNVVLMVTGQGANIRSARQQAKHFGFPIYAFPNEKSLDIWRRK